MWKRLNYYVQILQYLRQYKNGRAQFENFKNTEFQCFLRHPVQFFPENWFVKQECITILPFITNCGFLHVLCQRIVNKEEYKLNIFLINKSIMPKRANSNSFQKSWEINILSKQILKERPFSKVCSQNGIVTV